MRLVGSIRFEPPSWFVRSSSSSISPLYPRQDGREAVFVVLWTLIAHLSLLRILYHSRHIPQTLLQRLRELHRAGPTIAVKGRDWEDEAVFPHVVSAPVTIWHHRPVPDDHVVLRGHLQNRSSLHLRYHVINVVARECICLSLFYLFKSRFKHFLMLLWS